MTADSIALQSSKESPFRFISSFQGMIDYSLFGIEGRLHFRVAKNPWLYGHERDGKPTWNYKDEETFQRQHNANFGMLTNSNEPVDSETLRLFREHHCPEAKTGYFDHLAGGWVESEPVPQGTQPGHNSWIVACSNRTEKAVAAAKEGATPEAIEELKDCLALYMPKTPHTDEAKRLLATLPSA